jgi:transcriptional regulator with XRE-family HTH domain
MEALGFMDTSSIPWREAFPGIDDAALPGISLRSARRREGISQQRLSELTEIPQRHISEMENGKRPIGKDTAKRLAKVLNTGYKVFL